MAIISIFTDVTGQVGLKPRRVGIISTDNLATVTAANYLRAETLMGYVIYPTDIIEMWYGYVSNLNTGTFGVFTPNISVGVITLNAWENPGNVLLPVVDNAIASFNGSTGQIEDSIGTTIAHLGPIQSGGSSNLGGFHARSGTVSKGGFNFVASNNTGDTQTTFTNTEMGQTTTIYVADPGASTGYLNTSLVNASDTPLSALIYKDVQILFSDLAGAAHFTVQASSGSMQFQVRDIFVNYATGLSGGGGDRLLRITDGTTIWNNAGITASLLGTCVNTPWGSSGNPIPASGTSASTLSQPGMPIYAVYNGGAADYTTGSVLLTFVFQRVA